MYLLTDYSEEELRLMSTALSELLKNKEHILEYSSGMMPYTAVNNMRKDTSLIREMNVRALTALQIVRDRNLVMNQ